MSSSLNPINNDTQTQPVFTKKPSATQTSTKTPDYDQETFQRVNEGTLHANDNKASFISALDKTSPMSYTATRALVGAISVPLFITAVIFFPLTITGAWLTTTGQNQRVLGKFDNKQDEINAGTLKYNIGCVLAIALRLGLMCSYFAIKGDKSP